MKKPLEILCVADNIDPLVYSKSIRKRFGHMDAVFSCGDLKRDYYEFIVSSLNLPFVYVLGNHSPFSIRKTGSDWIPERESSLFRGGMLADGKSVYMKKLDLIAVGLGGSIRYSTGENQYTETEMFFRILKLLPALLWNRLIHGRYLDILVTHAPPRGINDREDPCHRGFRVFRWFLRRFRPQCMIHGHIHLFNYDTVRESFYRGIPVINVYDHYVLKLPAERSIDDERN